MRYSWLQPQEADKWEGSPCCKLHRGVVIKHQLFSMDVATLRAHNSHSHGETNSLQMHLETQILQTKHFKCFVPISEQSNYSYLIVSLWPAFMIVYWPWHAFATNQWLVNRKKVFCVALIGYYSRSSPMERNLWPQFLKKLNLMLFSICEWGAFKHKLWVEDYNEDMIAATFMWSSY